MSPRPYLDTLGLWDEAAAVPERLRQVLEQAHDTIGPADTWTQSPPSSPATSPPTSLAAFGLAGAGIACDAVAALTASTLAVPLVVGRSADVPAFVDASTLVFVVGGPTVPAEMVAVATAALERGATLVALGGDPAGPLASLSTTMGARVPWCPVSSPAGGVGGLAGMVVPMLVALHRVGLAADWTPTVEATADELARRRDVLLAPGGPAEELARRIGRTYPLVYGSSGLGAVAARWWKERVNRNAKSPALAGELPGVTYDELAGWGQSGDVTRQLLSLVLLRQSDESRRTRDLFAAVTAATDEVMADVLDVDSACDNDLSRFFDFALTGELVSLHLAGKEGVDPGPTPAIDDAQRDIAAP